MHHRFGFLVAAISLLGMAWNLALPGRGRRSAATATAADDKPLREQTIYIPYESSARCSNKAAAACSSLRQVPGTLAGRAGGQLSPAEARPPVGAVITAIDSEATAAKSVVRVRARLTIEVLGEEAGSRFPCGCPTAPSPPPPWAREPARIIGDAEKGYALLVEKEGEEAADLGAHAGIRQGGQSLARPLQRRVRRARKPP